MQHQNFSEEICFQLDSEDKQSAYYDGEFEYIEHRSVSRVLRVSKRREKKALESHKRENSEIREYNHFRNQHINKCLESSLKLRESMNSFMQFT